eukprot:m.80771 g.80771  ORF g.80771 m.80771 type:complete len:91 (-) comp8634_c0_seq2:3830-4102(-)
MIMDATLPQICTSRSTNIQNGGMSAQSYVTNMDTLALPAYGTRTNAGAQTLRVELAFKQKPNVTLRARMIQPELAVVQLQQVNSHSFATD